RNARDVAIHLHFPEPARTSIAILLFSEETGLRRERFDPDLESEPEEEAVLSLELPESEWHAIAHTMSGVDPDAPSYAVRAQFRVAPEEGDRVDLWLEPAASVRFRLLDPGGTPRGGEPVALAITDWPPVGVGERPPTWSWDSMTDPEGIAWIRGVPPESELVPSHAITERIRTLEPGSIVAVEVRSDE
ncbi:MAG TPA: hypothetical protein VK116_17160, partial [Planctomycetota bacterium]|nr:hypothetical protein [Planctomycetota bacterium]